MKIFRYMSTNEFLKFVNGEELTNKTKHEEYRTTSIGFCFMEGDIYEAESAYDFLKGIVSDEVCVIFKTNKKLNNSYGIYSDPYGSFFSTVDRDELCTTSYNNKDFKIINMAIPQSGYFDEWKWYKPNKLEEFVKEIKQNKKIKEEKEKREEEKNKFRKEIENKNVNDFLEAIKNLNNITLSSNKLQATLKRKDFNITDLEISNTNIGTGNISFKVNIYI